MQLLISLAQLFINSGHLEKYASIDCELNWIKMDNTLPPTIKLNITTK